MELAVGKSLVQRYVMRVLEDDGFHKIGVACHVCWNTENKTNIVVHGEDVLSVSTQQQLNWLDTVPSTHFDITAEPRVGPPKLVGVTLGSLLKRRIQWTDKGVHLESRSTTGEEHCTTILP